LEQILTKWIKPIELHNIHTNPIVNGNEPIVNVNILNDLRMLVENDNGEWLNTLIKKYIQSSHETLEQIQNAILQQNSEMVYVQAHKLRGSSSNIGAVRINALTELLEQPIEPDGFAEAQEIYDRLCKEFEITQRHLEAGYLYAR
jgi:HPt (histidine-containing phosphotransfer) domain-containing protein